MADECAYPVALPIPDHRIAILTARREEIRAVIFQDREGDMCDWPSVAWRDQRDGFDGVGHDEFAGREATVNQ